MLDTWPDADEALEAAPPASAGASCAPTYANIMKNKPKVKSSFDKEFISAFPLQQIGEKFTIVTNRNI
jgi:hypothetical protein